MNLFVGKSVFVIPDINVYEVNPLLAKMEEYYIAKGLIYKISFVYLLGISQPDNRYSLTKKGELSYGIQYDVPSTAFWEDTEFKECQIFETKKQAQEYLLSELNKLTKKIEEKIII